MTTEPGNKSGRHGQRAAVPTLAPQVKGDTVTPTLAGRTKGKSLDPTPTLAEGTKGESREKISEKIGMSHGTYDKAKYKNGDPVFGGANIGGTEKGESREKVSKKIGMKPRINTFADRIVLTESEKVEIWQAMESYEHKGNMVSESDTKGIKRRGRAAIRLGISTDTLSKARQIEG